MAKVLCALLTVAAASAVQVDVEPAGSGYIYRSDNGGPTSLTQLGAQKYAQPHAFTAPLPIALPIDEPIVQVQPHNSDIETYDYKPILIKYVEPSPQLYIDDDVDDDDASDSVEYVDSDLNAFDHGKVSENGPGTDYVEKHHTHKGEKSKKKYSSKDLQATGESGNYTKHQQERYISKARPENDAHRNEADSFRKHLEPRSSFLDDGGREQHVRQIEALRKYNKDRSSLHGGEGVGQYISESDAIKKYNEARSKFHGGDEGREPHLIDSDAFRNYIEPRSSFHGGEGAGQYISESDAIKMREARSKQQHAIRESGNYNEQQQEGHISEAQRDNDARRQRTDFVTKHLEARSSFHGGNEGLGQHFNKGEDITGYHNVFHKDEFKKDHDFYDVADNIGHFNTYGNEKGRYGSQAGGDKEGGHSFAGFYKREFGKAGIDAKGHHDASDISHSAEEGNESNDYHIDEYEKKGDKRLEKEYVYEDDDDDDEDDDEDHE